MTIGQRITQQRKELGLSQEALGEQLGVSRQSIYKWESDATLPEIEKLIALSQLFGVSVGWLLGVEEDAVTEHTDGNTMTQAQLDMVEQIVDRYIQAQPKPRKLRKWPWILAVCILTGAFIHLGSQIDQINNQYNNLQNSVSGISSSVNSQVNSLAGRVEQILKAQNNLTAEYTTHIVNTDYRNNTITIHMEAVPKTYTQGMRAVFIVDCGDGAQEFEGVLIDNLTFSAEAHVQLTDSISICVAFITPDGTRQTQVLESYSYLLSDSYAGLTISDYDLMWSKVADGRLVLNNWYVTTWGKNAGKGNAVIIDYRIGVFRNQKMIGWGEPCDKPGNYNGDYTDGQFFRMPNLNLEGLQDGETIEVAALITDSYGRQYVVMDIPYSVKITSDSGSGELTYPPIIEYDHNPANWTLD